MLLPESNGGYMVVDAHCDLLSALIKERRHLAFRSDKGHTDLPRLKQGGVKVQVVAAFALPTRCGGDESALRGILEQIDNFLVQLQEVPQFFGSSPGARLLLTRDDLAACLKQKEEVGFVLAVEGGEALGRSTGILRILYRLGVRCLTLTWNYANELAGGVLAKNDQGLTPAGRAVVKELGRLGMLLDLAHAGPRSYREALSLATGPVAVTHANCYTLCPHPRNLSDEQMRLLAEAGGILGISAVSAFVGVREEEATLNRLVDHIDYAVSIMGVDAVGLGLDLDGTEKLAGINHAGEIPLISEVLAVRGYRREEIEKIMALNWLRLLQQVLC